MAFLTLAPEQEAILKAVALGGSVFMTGPAGTGKTTTLRAIFAQLRCANRRFAVTAMTGCAAVLIGGRTVHSFLGIGLAKDEAAILASKVRAKLKHVVRKLLDLEVLIIDEISMMSADLLLKISQFLSIIRHNPAPFGGLQLVLSGDFHQLPPVDGDYAFTSPEWKRAELEQFELKINHRQSTDTAFQDILQRARRGRVTPEDIETLRATKNNVFPQNIVPTRLYARCRDVDAVNQHEFSKLDAEPVVYVAQCTAVARTWAQSCGIPETIALCVGAQVVLTWNINQDAGLVNGTRGVVTATAPRHCVLRLVDGRDVTIEYAEAHPENEPASLVRWMPLKLAWALTIHKCQGMTLDSVEIDLGHSIFEYGQAYTALSRARSLRGLRIIDVAARSFKTHPSVR